MLSDVASSPETGKDEEDSALIHGSSECSDWEDDYEEEISFGDEAIVTHEVKDKIHERLCRAIGDTDFALDVKKWPFFSEHVGAYIRVFMYMTARYKLEISSPYRKSATFQYLPYFSSNNGDSREDYTCFTRTSSDYMMTLHSELGAVGSDFEGVNLDSSSYVLSSIIVKGLPNDTCDKTAMIALEAARSVIDFLNIPPVDLAISVLEYGTKRILRERNVFDSPSYGIRYTRTEYLQAWQDYDSQRRTYDTILPKMREQYEDLTTKELFAFEAGRDYDKRRRSYDTVLPKMHERYVELATEEQYALDSWAKYEERRVTYQVLEEVSNKDETFLQADKNDDTQLGYLSKVIEHMLQDGAVCQSREAFDNTVLTIKNVLSPHIENDELEACFHDDYEVLIAGGGKSYQDFLRSIHKKLVDVQSDLGEKNKLEQKTGSPSAKAELEYKAHKEKATKQTSTCPTEPVVTTTERYLQQVLDLGKDVDLSNPENRTKRFNHFDNGDTSNWHQLLNKLSNRFGVSLSGIDTFSSLEIIVSTINERLAKRIDLNMRFLADCPDSTHKPKNLFITYPIMGSDTEVAELCRLVAGRSLNKANVSLYTLRSPIQRLLQAEADIEPLFSMAAQANIVVEAIRAVQHEGPYYLCGWSYGSVLAWAVAHQLRTEGGEVRFIGLIDPQLPHTLRSFSRTELINRLSMHINYAVGMILFDRDDYKIIHHHDFLSIKTPDDELTERQADVLIAHAIETAKSRLASATSNERLKTKAVYRLETLRANYLAIYHYELPKLERSSNKKAVNTSVFIAGDVAQALNKPEYNEEDITPYILRPEEYVVTGRNHFDVVLDRDFTRRFKQVLKHLDSSKLENRLLDQLDAHYQHPSFSEIHLSLLDRHCAVADCPPCLETESSATYAFEDLLKSHDGKPRRSLITADADSGKTHPVRHFLLKYQNTASKRYRFYIPLAKLLNDIKSDGLPETHLIAWVLHKTYFKYADVSPSDVQKWWRKLRDKRSREVVWFVDDVDLLLTEPESYPLLHALNMQPSDLCFICNKNAKHLLKNVQYYPDAVHVVRPLTQDAICNFINTMMGDEDSEAAELITWLNASPDRMAWAQQPRQLIQLCDAWSLRTDSSPTLSMANLLDVSKKGLVRHFLTEKGVDVKTLSFSGAKKLEALSHPLVPFMQSAAYACMSSSAKQLTRTELDNLLTTHSDEPAEFFWGVLTTGLLTPLTDELYGDVDRVYGFTNPAMMADCATSYVIAMLNGGAAFCHERLINYFDALLCDDKNGWLIEKLMVELNPEGIMLLLEVFNGTAMPQRQQNLRLIVPLCERALADDNVSEEKLEPLFNKISNTLVVFTQGISALKSSDHTVLDNTQTRDYQASVASEIDNCKLLQAKINSLDVTLSSTNSSMLEFAVTARDVGLIELLLQLDANDQDIKSALSIAQSIRFVEGFNVINESLISAGYQRLRHFLTQHDQPIKECDDKWSRDVDAALRVFLASKHKDSGSKWHEKILAIFELAKIRWLDSWQLGLEDDSSVQALLKPICADVNDENIQKLLASVDSARFLSIVSCDESIAEVLSQIIIDYRSDCYKALLLEYFDPSRLYNDHVEIYQAMTERMDHKKENIFCSDVLKKHLEEVLIASHDDKPALCQAVSAYAKAAITSRLVQDRPSLFDLLHKDDRFILLSLFKQCQEGRLTISCKTGRLLRQVLFNQLQDHELAILEPHMINEWLVRFDETSLSADQKNDLIDALSQHKNDKGEPIASSHKHIGLFAHSSAKTQTKLEVFDSLKHMKVPSYHSLYECIATATGRKKQWLRDESASLLSRIASNHWQSSIRKSSISAVNHFKDNYLRPDMRITTREACIRGRLPGTELEVLLLMIRTDHPIILINRKGKITNRHQPLADFSKDPIFLLHEKNKPFGYLHLAGEHKPRDILARCLENDKLCLCVPQKSFKSHDVRRERVVVQKPKRHSSYSVLARGKKFDSRVAKAPRGSIHDERLVFRRVAGDGHCFFESLAQTLEIEGRVLRRKVSSYMRTHRDEYIHLFPSPSAFERRLSAIAQGRSLRRNSVDNPDHWGGETELNAVVGLFQRPVAVLQEGRRPWVFPADWQEATTEEYEPIFVHYNGRDHYDAYLVKDGASGRELLAELEGMASPSCAK